MLLCACAALAFALVAGAPASADQAAADEYVLTLPGVEQSGPVTSAPIVVKSQRAGPVGVVGEDEAPTSQLSAIGSAISAPTGIAIVAVLALGAVLALRRRAESR